MGKSVGNGRRNLNRQGRIPPGNRLGWFLAARDRSSDLSEQSSLRRGQRQGNIPTLAHEYNVSSWSGSGDSSGGGHRKAFKHAYILAQLFPLWNGLPFGIQLIHFVWPSGRVGSSRQVFIPHPGPGCAVSPWIPLAAATAAYAL